MNIEDEARYGRTCSLVLNKSVTVLRRVIEHHYTSQGVLSFESHLNKNKHILFHLLFKQCCCGNTSYITPLNKTLWQLLYVRVSPTNPHGRRVECPCQYAAISGVTPDVMDITLCCLVIKNTCLGVTIPNVDTIREVRNQLIHASNASLGSSEFTVAWNKVEIAMLNLAKNISSTFRSETLKSVNELKNRLLDPSELSLLRDLVVDERRISGLEKDLIDVVQRVAEAEVSLTEQKENSDKKLQHFDGEIRKLRKDHEVLKARIPEQDGEYNEDIRILELQTELLKMNQVVTEAVSLSPLQKTKRKIPSDLIFAPVMIREDLENTYNDCVSGSSGNTKLGKQINAPDDIFFKDGEPIRNIFMQGEAAHGKTMYCKQLLRYWCTAIKAGSNKEGLTEWERGLGQFDFVFLILLRMVNKTRLSIADMICKDLFKYKTEYTTLIQHVLSSHRYRCLILLDGLDEWKISPRLIPELTRKGIPDIENLSKCTLFFTFRPWIFATIADTVTSFDRIIHIYGLDDGSKDIVTEKVLVHYYNMDKTSDQYKLAKSDILKKLNDKNLKSIMDIPLLLVVSIMLWQEKKDIGNSFTSFYIALVQLLLKRAIDADLVNTTPDSETSLSTLEVPEIIKLSKNKTFRNFLGTLCSLGDIAYEDTMSDETRLVFGKDELEERLSLKVLNFGLKVGLLSQCEAPGVFDEENVSVNFFHKTVQEFLTALYVVCGRKIEPFCRQLNSIKRVHDMSNVLLFISGLSPKMGSVVSEGIVNLANNDPELLVHRMRLTSLSETVKDLYYLQASCFREIKCSNDMRRGLGTKEPFHVADIHFMGYVSSEYADETADILENHFESLVSLTLVHVPDDPIYGIRYEILYDLFRRKSRTLKSLTILGMNLSTFGDKLNLYAVHMTQVNFTNKALLGFQKCIQHSKQLHSLTLRNVSLETEKIDQHGNEVLYLRETVSFVNLMRYLPNCLHLSHICYCGYNNTIPSALRRELDSIPELGDIEFHDFTYKHEHELMKAIVKLQRLVTIFIEKVLIKVLPDDLSVNWTRVEKIVLDEVIMSALNWHKFVLLLLGIDHRCEIRLRATNIDDVSINLIRSSPHTTITEDKGYSFSSQKTEEGVLVESYSIQSLTFIIH